MSECSAQFIIVQQSQSFLFSVFTVVAAFLAKEKRQSNSHIIVAFRFLTKLLSLAGSFFFLFFSLAMIPHQTMRLLFEFLKIQYF